MSAEPQKAVGALVGPGGARLRVRDRERVVEVGQTRQENPELSADCAEVDHLHDDFGQRGVARHVRHAEVTPPVVAADRQAVRLTPVARIAGLQRHGEPVIEKRERRVGGLRLRLRPGDRRRRVGERSIRASAAHATSVACIDVLLPRGRVREGEGVGERREARVKDRWPAGTQGALGQHLDDDFREARIARDGRKAEIARAIGQRVRRSGAPLVASLNGDFERVAAADEAQMFRIGDAREGWSDDAEIDLVDPRAIGGGDEAPASAGDLEGEDGGAVETVVEELPALSAVQAAVHGSVRGRVQNAGPRRVGDQIAHHPRGLVRRSHPGPAPVGAAQDARARGAGVNDTPGERIGLQGDRCRTEVWRALRPRGTEVAADKDRAALWIGVVAVGDVVVRAGVERRRVMAVEHEAVDLLGDSGPLPVGAAVVAAGEPRVITRPDPPGRSGVAQQIVEVVIARLGGGPGLSGVLGSVEGSGGDAVEDGGIARLESERVEARRRALTPERGPDLARVARSKETRSLVGSEAAAARDELRRIHGIDGEGADPGRPKSLAVPAPGRSSIGAAKDAGVGAGEHRAGGGVESRREQKRRRERFSGLRPRGAAVAADEQAVIRNREDHGRRAHGARGDLDDAPDVRTHGGARPGRGAVGGATDEAGDRRVEPAGARRSGPDREPLRVGVAGNRDRREGRATVGAPANDRCRVERAHAKNHERVVMGIESDRRHVTKFRPGHAFPCCAGIRRLPHDSVLVGEIGRRRLRRVDRDRR